MMACSCVLRGDPVARRAHAVDRGQLLEVGPTGAGGFGAVAAAMTGPGAAMESGEVVAQPPSSSAARNEMRGSLVKAWLRLVERSG